MLVKLVLVHASVFAQSGWVWQNSVSPTTAIRFALPKASRAVLKLYDILGREVATLVNGVEEPGYKSKEKIRTSVLCKRPYQYQMQ
jgi:hypothetical protein